MFRVSEAAANGIYGGSDSPRAGPPRGEAVGFLRRRDPAEGEAVVRAHVPAPLGLTAKLQCTGALQRKT